MNQEQVIKSNAPPKTAGAKSESLSHAPDRQMKIRLNYTVFIALMIFVAFIFYFLHRTAVYNSNMFREYANAQQLNDFILRANRGAVFDRNGELLAQSTPVWDVILSPFDVIENEDCPDAIATMLHEILGVDKQDVLDKVDKIQRRYEVIARRVDRSVYEKINEQKAEKGIGLFSIYLVETSERSYPNNRLASNLIGFTNYDNKGQYGVEAYYNQYLQGTDGRVVMLRDGVGRTMSREFERRFEATDGNNVHMTIDVVLQHYLEKQLEEVVIQHKVANRATGIMMEPNTGAILAMATTFGYDPNAPAALSEADEAYLEKERERLIDAARSESTLPGGVISQERMDSIDEQIQKRRHELWELQWRNKAVTELYFPGSVFKTITAAMALEERVATLDSTFSCGPGYVEVADTRIHCWAYGRTNHGTMCMTQSITTSCNPAFINIGSRVGVRRFYDYLEAFGLTARTGIDAPAEARSIVVRRDRMSSVDLAMSSIGQTNKITPLQMITAYAACINGGYLVTPHLVDRISDADGNVVRGNTAVTRRQILSSETSAQMRKMMEDVVQANGGSNAYISGYRIGGKSGTSEKIDEYAPDDMRYVASFAAFAPADNPKVIMLVVVDEPMGGLFYGSQIAAPVVSAVFRDSFAHLEIFPQFTAEEQALQDTLTPYLVGLSPDAARERLNRDGLNFTSVGEGSRVLSTIPTAGTPIGSSSSVMLIYCEETAANLPLSTVPNVLGMGVSAANQAITNAGLNIRFSGGAVANTNARAAHMSLEPGEQVPPGTVVEVRFTVDVGHGG
ncbi:MAG: penicillin-binding transpeptidase domain-containing protein [Oscillospiraceae bacterium]|nr:penicillin-binding transpeptidase domain-containing protein [Oscillospiraceae bacterium]